MARGVEGLIAQFGDQGGDLGFAEIALVHQAVDGEGNREDGIAEGVALCLDAGAFGQVQKRLDEGIGGLCIRLGVVGHGRSVAFSVPGASDLFAHARRGHRSRMFLSRWPAAAVQLPVFALHFDGSVPDPRPASTDTAKSSGSMKLGPALAGALMTMSVSV